VPLSELTVSVPVKGRLRDDLRRLSELITARTDPA
jgi:hypothetical protein